MVLSSVYSRQTKSPEIQTHSRRRRFISTAIAIGAISFVGGPSATQVPELHAASPIQQGNEDEQKASFGSLEGSLTPARPLGNLMVAATMEASRASTAVRTTPSKDYIRKVTKRCRVAPRPGPRFCPEKRGPDYVPPGGWKKVALKPGFNDWKDKNTMFWNEAKRKPVLSRNLPIREIPEWLYFRVPYDPVYGFAPPREEIFEHLTESQINTLKALAKCETGDRPKAVSDDGVYVGAYQFDAEGGYVDRHAPDVEQLYKYRGAYFRTSMLTQGEQDIIAIRGIWYGSQGLEAYPTCGAGL